MVNEKVSIWIKLALGLAVLVIVAAVAIVALDDGGDDDGEVAQTGGDAGEVEIPEDALDATGEATVEISITDNLFEPGTVIVSPGTEVVWTNNGLNDHNVKPDDPVSFEAIPTDDLARDASAGRTFDDAGAYAYYCSIHGAPGVGQFGTIIVS